MSSSRRQFLRAGATALAVTPILHGTPTTSSARLANGVKVGEVTDSTAILWARLTASVSRVTDGLRVVGRPSKNIPAPPIADVNRLEGACPGSVGLIRVRYMGPNKFEHVTEWVKVDESTDFTHQFHLINLPADSIIKYLVETAHVDNPSRPDGAFAGTFRTAPHADQTRPITFAVITCQMYCHLDEPEGFHVYPAIGKLTPHFVAVMGDNVYYDGELPLATNTALARYHWQRMYSLPRHVELYRTVTSYWAKDDHDTVKDDCWPGQKLGDLTFEEGLKIFRQQVPMGQLTYRSFRWGKNLQIWITEGRDFRSANNLKDGPDKTIWGARQKAWLFRTLKESDATWKVLISPTPLVGPDRDNKGDNHANRAFKHEGDEARSWFRSHVPDNFFVICGDRHWQYHSVHPESGLNEFSVGAACDEHAGGSPGENPDYHRFHRVKGGYASVVVEEKSISFRHHDVHGQVVYEKTFKA